MQSPVLKIILLISFLSVIAMNVSAQSLGYHLSKADSLYKQKRYTQSLELYQSIFAQKQYTPAMFLKMAFIEEGLGHITPAMYYLNLYYIATKDERVLAKISDVATKQGLNGYTISDTEQIIEKYAELYEVITGALASLIIFLMSVIAYQRKKKVKPVTSWVILLFVLIVLFIHINIPIQYASAIVSKPNSYLMSGPSAGASVIRIIDEGHRVQVIGQHDVWVKVRINNREAYIKKDNLYPLSL